MQEDACFQVQYSLFLLHYRGCSSMTADDVCTWSQPRSRSLGWATLAQRTLHTSCRDSRHKARSRCGNAWPACPSGPQLVPCKLAAIIYMENDLPSEHHPTLLPSFFPNHPPSPQSKRQCRSWNVSGSVGWVRTIMLQLYRP